MISSNDFKKGLVIEVDGKIYTIVEFQHVKPGKGGAFVRAKLKSLIKGSVIDKTFRGGVKVKDVRIEKNTMQYLYDEGDSLVFMDNETYEQMPIGKDFVGDILNYIVEGDLIEVSSLDGKPISLNAPNFVELEVVYAEPGIKGDTATNVTKVVKVQTGAEFSVPLFINNGEKIKIDTRTGEYVERVK